MPSGLAPEVVVGRYALYDAIAAGGMARIHLARQGGNLGFTRVVAVKRMLPQFSADPEFVTMFLDEARLAARVRHPNVVATLDVVHEGDDLFIVMEYVPGESLAALMRSASRLGEPLPVPVAVSIAVGLLRGLNAAHVTTAKDGSPLGIIHRDVSPQNVHVGLDGHVRVLDFGIAKANVRFQQTREGQLKGKLAYMAPEQLRDDVSPASDVYSAGIVTWEMLARRRLFSGENEGSLLLAVVEAEIPSLARVAPWVPADLAAVVERALQKSKDDRFRTAEEMALALERTGAVATPDEVAAVVKQLGGMDLERRVALARAIEQDVPDLDAETVETVTGSVARSAREIETIPRASSDEQTTRRDGSLAELGTRHTLTAPVKPAVTRSRSLLRPGILAIFALVAGAAAAVTLYRQPRTAAPVPAADAPMASAAPGPRATLPDPSALPPAAPAAREGPSAVAISSAVDPPGPPRRPTGPVRTASAMPPLSPTGGQLPLPPAAALCDPPFYTDERGIQRIKRECFKAH